VVEYVPGFLQNFKQLKQQWRQATREKEEAIRKMTRLNWEAYWQYLVKPYSQWMTLQCLTSSTQKMVPALTNAVFTGQFKFVISRPTQVKLMTDICDLKDPTQRS